MRILKRLLRYALYLALAGILFVAGAIGVAYWLLAPRLPSVAVLRDYHMQVPLRVLSSDGRLIASFGETRRIPVRIADVPARLKNAVLSAEDADFYSHPGVDWHGIARAGIHVVLSGGDKGPGGSTITQQVARNFFLSPEKLYSRKLTEMFIALRMENELTKDQILELYINKMFLGHRSYGLAAAAAYYYGKNLDQLTVAESAALASTFQLPSVVNPLNNGKRLIARRNWVLGQMLANRFITKAEYDEAIDEPNDAFPHEQQIEVDAPYLAEMVRQQVLEKLGNDALTEGYIVHTTVPSDGQAAANEALRNRLSAYDRRHGYRGPEGHEELSAQAGPEDYDRVLAGYTSVAGMIPGIVTETGAKEAKVYLSPKETVTLSLASMAWARPYVNEGRAGAAPTRADAVLKRGDVVRLFHAVKDDVNEDAATEEGKPAASEPAQLEWRLTQIPAVQAALVSLDPEDGAVRALVGGFSFTRSKFNRAVMAARQPGSSFKPYLYSAAFERGFTPASIVNDAPVAFPDPSRPDGMWTPANDDNKFSGPMRLREALVQSKNLVSVRLLDAMGLRFAREYMTRFGFTPDALPQNLSLALGTASVSPMSMARGYAVFANGGYLVTPYFISRIDDRDGNPVYVANPERACAECQERLLNPTPPGPPTQASTALIPARPATAGTAGGGTGDAVLPADAHANASEAPKLAPHVIDVRNDYLVTSLMQDVIKRGTGSAAKALGRDDLAGKTGSTNDHRDAWFVGFNGDISSAVWVGFDDFSSLGRGEFGAKAALPIWMDYMGAVLKDKPSHALAMPPGIATVQVDPGSGLPSNGGMNEIMKVEDVDRLREQATQKQQEEQQEHAYDIF
ncbi:penicillin-binding protein 1A [Luteibacter sp. UNC138MFCol5.1]|uniref:penicillin-binding protein 1A n=1 Tax=Luteibacter sp. UNC138MFCol5.1 TaxID=1502774 RepID=UPI0008C09DFD|nr:penicillin-binding protein 1A [Luteibacter sp. UNC138MFCol5.1]SEO45563.1 penicillin-binding protein 1A [Luteibacter sp. UNC138MFCol5.1]